MNTVKVENCNTLFIGRRGENEVTEVVFDFTEWQEQFGTGVIDLYVKRSVDFDAYPVVLSIDGTVATWLVTDADTAVVGNGKIEFVYTVNEKVAKSAVFPFYVGEDIGQASSEPPDPYESWIETLTELGTETQANAQAAAQSASDAADSAASASESAVQAEDSAEDAEAWAVGERGGEPVPAGDETYENNAKYWAENARANAPVQSVNGKDGNVELTLDDIPNGETYARATPSQLAQIGKNADDIADIDAMIPSITSESNHLVNVSFLTNRLTSYRTSAAQDTIDAGKQEKITAYGILKRDRSGNITAAVAGADYVTADALNSYRKATAQDAIDNAQNQNIDKNAAAINTMQPAATAADIGKALIVKTVADGKPTSYEYGEAGGGGSALTAGDGIDITEDVISNTQGIEYVVGTQAAATSKWTGVSTDETLKVGKIIAYYLPYAGTSTAATLALTMADGTTTREISLQYKPNSAVTTQFPAGSIIILVYDGTYWRVNASYDTDTNTYPTGYCVTNGAVAAKTAACSFGYRGDTNYFPCLFRFANTAADATLAITTYAPEAAPIYVNGQRTSATNTFSAGVILFLYYNGAYYCYNDGRFPILVDGAVTSVQEYAAGLLVNYRTAAAQDTIDNGKQAKITATGILKGDGAGGVSSATAGTDYATPQQVSEKYTKPSDGIPQTDMTAAVQASLSKADSALQEVPDTYRTAAAQDTIDAGKQNKITASGILKGDGAGGVSAAVAGTDYLAPSALEPYRTAADQDLIDSEQGERLDAVEQTTTATTIGPVALAKFNASAADMPLKGLTVDIEPVQSGSGDPSPDNVRPITGWTGCKLHRTGVSLIGGDAFIGNTFAKTADGYSFSYNGSSIANRASAWADIRGLPAGRYTIAMLNPSYPAGVEVNIRRITAGSTVAMGIIIGSDAYGRRTYNIPENTTSLQLYIIQDTTSLNTRITMSDIVIVREGDEPEPYKGNTYNITFPAEAGTVYGGTLSINADGSGELTVDAQIAQMDALTWNTETGSVVRFFCRISGMKRAAARSLNIICSCYKANIGGAFNDDFTIYNAANNELVYLYDSRYTTLAEFLPFLEGQYFVYPLQNPITYKITAEQVTTILGANNIWADCGDVTVTYGAYLETVKAYADQVGDSILSAIATLETSYTASRAYAAGSFLFVGTKFYKVTAAIASGDTITPDTNVTQTTVAEQLMALANV